MKVAICGAGMAGPALANRSVGAALAGKSSGLISQLRGKDHSWQEVVK